MSVKDYLRERARENERAFDESEDGYFYFSGSYEDLFEGSGLRIELARTFGSYQGDYAVVVSRDGQYASTVFGFGSCSGCDSLEACNSWADVESLASSLTSGLTWYDSKEDVFNAVFETVTAKDDSQWYYFEDGYVEWVRNDFSVWARGIAAPAVGTSD